jgi:hypothetical protein
MITISLQTFLAIHLKYKDRADLSYVEDGIELENLVKQLSALALLEQTAGARTFHLQIIPPDQTDKKSKPIYVVWRYNEWVIDQQKYLIDKDKAEKRLDYHNRRHELREKLCKAVKQSFGPTVHSQIVETVVASIITKKSYMLAEQFNISKDELAIIFEEQPE